MSCEAGDDFPDVYEATVRRSRKNRPCHACELTIRRGDLYYTERALWEGSWDVTNRCARCEAMVRVLSPLMSEDTVCDPKLNCGHRWEDNFGEPPPAEVQALAFLTPGEAQVLLQRWPAYLGWSFHGPREAPERTIARLLGWWRSAA